MAIRRRRHAHTGKGERRKHAKELASRLAPPEEQEAAAAAESQEAAGQGGDVHEGHAPDDTIRVDAKNLKLPEKFLEDERGAAHVFRLEPVALVILVAFLTFVAFIAWQITLMPPTK